MSKPYNIKFWLSILFWLFIAIYCDRFYAQNSSNRRIIEEMVDSLNNKGLFFYHDGQFDKAILEVEKAYQLSESIRDDKTTLVILYNLSNIYITSNKLNHAVRTLYQAKELAVQMGDFNMLIHINLNLSVVCKYVHDWDKSVQYTKSALNYVSLANKDSLYIEKRPYIYYALASCYLELEKLELSRKSIENGIAFLRNNQDTTGLFVFHFLEGRYHQKTGDVDKAREYFNLTLREAEENKNHPAAYGSMVESLIGTYDLKIDGVDKLDVLLYAEKINDEFVNSTIFKKKILERKIKNLNFSEKDRAFFASSLLELKEDQHATSLVFRELYQTDLDIVQQRADQTIEGFSNIQKLAFFKSSFVVCLLLIVILSILFYWSRKKRKKQALEIVELQMEKQDRVLSNALLRNTHQEEAYKNMLHKINAAEERGVTIDEIKSLKVMLTSELASEKSWDKFKQQFEKIHPNFYKSLEKKCPAITKNEMKLCVYLKMKLDTKEIASILNVTPETVRKSKYRLKKKIDLDTSVLLDNWIADL